MMIAESRITLLTSGTGHHCVICRDPIFDVEVRAPCGHFYDIDCITDLFQSATRDETLYPPRCCGQNIRLSQVQPHLTQALLAELELKAREFGTLNRVYCATPACSRFLGPLHEGYFKKVFKCTSPTCTTMTCGKCRGKYKRWRHNCTPDAETERVLTLSSASGWSRCPGCANMIEHNRGCYHMTCRCKTQFCYLCRARWGSCRCAQWGGNGLLAAVQHVYAQLQPAHHAQPPNPPRQALAVHRPTPAAGAGRNRYVNLPRQAPATAPRPAQAVYVRPTAYHAEAEAPAPRNGTVSPLFDARTHIPTARHVTCGAPALPCVPLPVENARNHGTRVALPQPPSTAGHRNTSGLELFRVNHDCQHTIWRCHRGGGRCESCSVGSSNCLFVSPFRRLVYIYTLSDLIIL
jgi:hypothetical protein